LAHEFEIAQGIGFFSISTNGVRFKSFKPETAKPGDVAVVDRMGVIIEGVVKQDIFDKVAEIERHINAESLAVNQNNIGEKVYLPQ